MTLRYFHNNPTAQTRALQIYLILIGAAWRRETLTYTELAGMLGFGTVAHPAGGVMGQFLGPIMNWCQSNNLPPLTSIVVSQTSGTPGPGLTTLSSVLPAEQQKVFQSDWFSIYPPTVEELP